MEAKSQKQLVLEYLEKGNTITPIEALNMFGTFRLASRINELRDEGHSIKTIRHITHSGKSVAMYHMTNIPVQKSIHNAYIDSEKIK
jgi:hypothetical protein